MSYNRCKDTHKFGNKYLPSAYKTQVDFRSYFSGKKSASYSPRNTIYKNYLSKSFMFIQGLVPHMIYNPELGEIMLL